MLLFKTDLSAQIFEKPSINNRSELKLYLRTFKRVRINAYEVCQKINAYDATYLAT